MLILRETTEADWVLYLVLWTVPMVLGLGAMCSGVEAVLDNKTQAGYFYTDQGPTAGQRDSTRP